MCSKALEIRTKAMCLFCYNRSCRSTPLQRGSTYSKAVSGFGKLLCHLEVDSTLLYLISRQFLINIGYDGEDNGLGLNEDPIEVGVSFCFTCSLAMEKFDQLFDEFGTSSRRLDKYVQLIYEAIKQADQSPTRVREYMEQVKSEQLTIRELFHASFTGSLRIQTLKRCFSKFEGKHGNTDEKSSIFTSANETLISNSPSCSTSSTSTSGHFDNNHFVERDLAPPLGNAAFDTTLTKEQSQPPRTTAVVENIFQGDAVVAHTPADFHNVDDEPTPPVLEPIGIPISSIEVRSTSDMTSTSGSTSGVNLSLSQPLQPPEMNVPVSSTVSMAGVVESNTRESNTNSGLTLMTTDTTRGIASADTEIVNKRFDRSMSTAPSSEATDTRSIPARTNSLSAVSTSDVVVESTSKFGHFSDCVLNLVTPVVESISGGDHNHNLSLEPSPLQRVRMDIASPSNEMSGHASRVDSSVSSRYALRQLIPSRKRNVDRVRLEEATQEVARNFEGEGGSSTQLSIVDNHPQSDPRLQYKRYRIECYICNSRFNSVEQLTEHRSVNGRARDVDMCCFCDYTSGRSWGALINHLRSVHTVHMVTRWIPGKGEEPVGREVDKIIANIPANGQRCERCGEEMESFDSHKTHLFAVHFKEIVEQIKSGFKKGEVERQLGLVATSAGGKSNAQLLDDIGSSSSLSGARNARKTHDDYQHMCPTCSKIYKHYWDLHSHVLYNHPEYLVRHYFPLGLKSECTHERCEHVRNSIVPSKVTPCPYCKEKYTSLDISKKHVVNIHTSTFAKEVLSHVRSLTTQSQDDGETSTDSQGEGSKRALVQCEWCGDTFHSREQLTQHKNRNETGTETCSICDEPISCCSTLRDHLRSAHTVPLLMDEVTTTNKTGVSRALDKIMDGIPTNDHRCARCGEETGSFESLQRHFLVAHFTELVKQVSSDRRLNSY